MTKVEVEVIALTEKSSRENRRIVYDKLNETASLRDLLAALSTECGEIKAILNHGLDPTGHEMVILVNGKYPSNGLSTKLKDDDKITILPVIVGG